jgi:integrase
VRSDWLSREVSERLDVGQAVRAKYPEQKRERSLNAAELKRLEKTLNEMEAEGIELPGAITAVRLLLLSGCRPGQRLSDLQPFWCRVRARAGIKDVPIQDMRHTFAFVAVASGQGLPMIGKLLGHSQVQTTAKYAHLGGDPTRQAGNDVAPIIARQLG